MLFDAEYVVGGSIQAQRLIPSARKENLVLNAIHRAVRANESTSLSVRYPVASIADFAQMAYTANHSAQAEAYWSYGKGLHPDGIPRTGRWTPGALTPLPEVEVFQDFTLVTAIIEAEIGEMITVSHHTYSLANAAMLRTQWLDDSPDYVIHKGTYFFGVANDFTKVSDGERYGIVGVLDQATLETFVGSTITFGYQKKISLGVIYETEVWIWDDTAPVQTLVIDLGLTNTYLHTDLLHSVLYTLNSTLETKMWFYRQSDNTHPEIHTTVIFDEVDGAYPFAMIIADGQNVAEDALGVEYKLSTKYLLQKLGIDQAELMESMVNPDEPDNLKDVQDAYVLYAAQVRTNNQETLSYLYELFRQSHYLAGASTQQDAIDAGFEQLGSNGSQFEGPYAGFFVKWDFTRIEIITGLISDPWVKPDVNVVPAAGAEIDPDHNGTTSVVNGVIIGEMAQFRYLGLVDSYDENGLGRNNHVMEYRKQLTETTYVQIAVHGLTHHTKLTERVDGFQRSVYIINTVFSDRNEFYIPLTHTLMKKFDLIVSHHIFNDCLQLVISVFQAEKLPWWASAGFAFLLTVVITIVTAGTGTTTAGTTVQQFLTTQAINYAVGKLLVELFVLLSPILGKKVTAAIAVALAVMTIRNSGTQAKGFGLLSAQQLLTASSAAFGAVGRLQEEQLAEIQEEIVAEGELQEKREDHIQALQDLLGPTTEGLHLYDIVSSREIKPNYATPTESINMALEGNIGVLSLDMIDIYVDNLLTLPRYEDNRLA